MSSDVAIRVENLSKVYRIGAREARYKTLRESVMDVVGAPLKRLRRRAPTEEETLWALKDVSFEIKKGEVVGIIGRNGAGKSTLLKILSRITEPTSGRAEIHGRVGSLLEVGTGFHPELTGRENIYLNGAILGMRRAEIDRKLDEIVAFAEVERFLDTAVKHYSSGMYLRLAFAVAAHLDTEVLLVDEVLAVGDASFQKRCLERLHDVSHLGRTVLFVSHNLSAVRSLCSRSIWLENGGFRIQGPSETVVMAYLGQGADVRTSISWPEAAAPSGGPVRLRAVRLTHQGDETGPPHNEMPLGIGVDWDVTRGGHRINVSIQLVNHEGVCVFASASTVDPEHRRPLPPASYRSVCTIPAWLLNVGSYRVDVMLVEDASRVLARAPSAIEFRVEEAGNDRHGWLGPWPGIVRPRLSWSTHSEAP